MRVRERACVWVGVMDRWMDGENIKGDEEKKEGAELCWGECRRRERCVGFRQRARTEKGS